MVVLTRGRKLKALRLTPVECASFEEENVPVL